MSPYTIQTTEIARVVMTVGPEANFWIPNPRVTIMITALRKGIHRSPKELSASLLIPFSVDLKVMVCPAKHLLLFQNITFWELIVEI